MSLRHGRCLTRFIHPGLTSNKNTYLNEESRYSRSLLHARQGSWELCEKQQIMCEDSSLKHHTLGLMTGLNPAVEESLVQGKFSCVLLRISCHESKGQGLLATSHLCFSRSAAHPGEKGTPPLCQVDSMTSLSPATLFDPLSSVSSTRPPPVNSHCSDLKLYPRGKSSRQQRPCDTKLWMNLSS